MFVSAQSGASFDSMLLAMDVVDSLRRKEHVLSDLADTDEKKRLLREKLRAQYDSYGIDVSDELLDEGVKALFDNRFTYKRPEPSFALRLASWYIDRKRIGQRVFAAAAVILVAVASFHAIKYSAHLSEMEELRSQVAGVLGDVDSVAQSIEASVARLERLGEPSDRVAKIAGTWTTEANAEAENGRNAIAKLSSIATPDSEATRVEVDAWRSGMLPTLDVARASRARLSAGVDRLHELFQIDTRFGQAVDRKEGQTLPSVMNIQWTGSKERALAMLGAGSLIESRQAVDELHSILDSASQITGLEARIKSAHAEAKASGASGSDMVPATEMRQRALEALGAGNVPLAASVVQQLEAEAALLSQSYTLQVVARPGVQSGVWRYPRDNRSARNYYIVVEALGEQGRALSLPIQNEEDGVTRTVSMFAIRVSADQYEAVKADKMDNGIVDNKVVGTKSRGKRDPNYNMTVAGGHITSW